MPTRIGFSSETSKMRAGIGFNGDMPVLPTIQYARVCDELGLDSFWLHENSFSRDAFSYLNDAAQITSKIRLGAGCISAYSRHPIVNAMSFLTLQESSSGRAVMGLGTGYPMRLDQMGLKHDKPIAALKQTIEICRSIWKGETVSFQGSEFSVKGARSLPGRVNPIPIYIAGWKDQMLALTGRLADGYIAKGGESPLSLKRLVNGIKDSAERNGRKISDIDISAYLLTSVASKREEALELARNDPFVCYMLSVQDDYLYEETGIDPESKKPIATNYFKGNLKEAQSHITDEMLSAFVLAGRPDDIRERVESYEASGLNLAIFQPISMEQEHVRLVLELARTLIDDIEKAPAVQAMR